MAGYMRGLILVVVVLAMLPWAHASASDDVESSQPFHPCLSGGVKKSVVFLGFLKRPPPPTAASPQAPVVPETPKTDSGEAQFSGTGVLITFDNIIYLVTAKHVVGGLAASASPDHDPAVFFNNKTGKAIFLRLRDIKMKLNADWVLSPDADLAIIPFLDSPTSTYARYPIRCS